MGVDTSNLQVIYLTGLGRSGSTLLGQILGASPGVFYAGEVRYLWERGVLNGESCGCGRAVVDCEIWGAVIRRVQAELPDLTPERLTHLRRTLTKTRHVPVLMTGVGRKIIRQNLSSYVASLGSLYRALGGITGSRVIVDSSSSPVYGYALTLVEGLRVHIIHLVRDPRGHAHSWRQRREWGDPSRPGSMPRYSVVKSTIWWVVWNLLSESLGASDGGLSTRIRYEDLVGGAPQTLEKLARDLGVGFPADRLLRLDPVTLDLPSNHAVAGNPTRFLAGPVQLVVNEAWRTQMGRFDKAMVSALSWPLALRYGYRVLAG